MKLTRKLPTTLIIGHAEVLFNNGIPAAIFDGEVFFPDSKTTGAETKQLNKFHPDVPRTRIPVADFNWYIASTLMRQLRTLLRRTDDPASDT